MSDTQPLHPETHETIGKFMPGPGGQTWLAFDAVEAAWLTALLARIAIAESVTETNASLIANANGSSYADFKARAARNGLARFAAEAASVQTLRTDKPAPHGDTVVEFHATLVVVRDGLPPLERP